PIPDRQGKANKLGRRVRQHSRPVATPVCARIAMASLSDSPRTVNRRRRSRHGSARKMILYHVTPRRNMASINRHGLLPEKATGRQEATWLVSRSQIVWAIAHTATKRDKAPITKLVVLRVEVPRSRVRRFRRGIWRSFEPLRSVGCEPASAYTLS